MEEGGGGGEEIDRACYQTKREGGRGEGKGEKEKVEGGPPPLFTARLLVSRRHRKESGVATNQKEAYSVRRTHIRKK